MVPNPRPRGQFIPVDRTPLLPGSPRVRRAPAIGATPLRDGSTRQGVNAGDGSVWGSRVAPVTGRRSRRSPGWESNVSGGSHVETQGQRWVL